MSLGKPKESTKAIYMSLRDAGKRILIRANASPEVLPAGDVEEYTKLMSALERYYAE
jgi:hypothetical protein